MVGDERDRQQRAGALLVIVGLGMVAVLLTLVSMQIIHQGTFASLARDNRQFHTRVLAPRGIISDRNGNTLADNVHQARITISRRIARRGHPSLEALIELLDLDTEPVFARIARSPEEDPITIVRHAAPEQIAKVEEHRPVLPHVQLTVAPRRNYRRGSLAAHVLGYVGEVRSSDIEVAQGVRSHEPGDIIGRTGVEAFAEPLLRGRHGRKVVEVNAAGHVVGELEEGSVPALPGVQLYLTLSDSLQARLEELLRPHVAAGVVLEVATGDVLAASSSPSFDPNEFTAGISEKRWSELNSDPRKPLFNRTFRGAYPPGSPFKLVTAAAALERNRITEYTTFEPCYGGYRFGNRVFGCWNPAGHGTLNLKGAIAQSCDVYFYQVAELLTIDELAETARRFGFGRKSGLELPGEVSGLVPTSSYFDERYGTRGWTHGLVLNCAIGQGELLVTPLQLARAYAALGGDGHLYRPNVVLAQENAYGVRQVRRVRRTSEPVCSERVRRILKSALYDVVAHEEGTGGLATVEGVPVSGKTGTAENPHGQDHAWFVAYAPSEHPEVAVAVIVENAGHGGSVAAPIVGQLLRSYFRWQRSRPAAPFEVGR